MADRPSHILLRFNPDLPEKELKKIRDNVSAVVLAAHHLWLGGDEGTSIHRMTRDASGHFGDHTSFELKGILQLTADEEIDIEGLDLNEGYLWLVGSHSAKRKKADDEETMEKNLKRLTTIEVEGNRFTLARVPVDDLGRPVAAHQGLTAARLQGTTKANVLTDALAADPHVGRFVPRVLQNGSIQGIPSKDNGFDIEGLAVKGNRVFVGLRGPVLRGWAIIIELQLGTAGGALTLEHVGSSGQPYLKHLLDVHGLGIRELVTHGDDLLVLCGPSMDLDGPVFIYRWKEGLNERADSLTWNKDLKLEVTVPFGAKKDHAEGLSRVTDNPLSVLVCYDSPSRVLGAKKNEVEVDIFEITL